MAGSTERQERATIRARSSRDTLAYLDVYRAGARAEVERTIPKDVLDAIDGPGITGYVPLEADSRMGEAIVAYLGRDGALRFWVRFITHHLDSPILAATVRTAISLFGATPGGLLRWLPKGLSLIFRDAFDATVELSEANSAVVRFVSRSDVFFESTVYPLVLEAMVRAIYVATSVEGRASVHRDAASRTFVVSASWDA